MENTEKDIDMKKYVDIANEKRNEKPTHVIVSVVDAMIEAGLIDEEGNIINKPETTGKQK